MLSISVPSSGTLHSTLPSAVDSVAESGNVCQSCQRNSGTGLSCNKMIQPPCSFNMSTDQDSMMRYFLDRQKFTEDGQAVVIEWRQLAAAVDRILFWVFCIMTCVSSALFLIIIPGYNRGWFSPKSLWVAQPTDVRRVAGPATRINCCSLKNISFGDFECCSTYSARNGVDIDSRNMKLLFRCYPFFNRSMKLSRPTPSSPKMTLLYSACVCILLFTFDTYGRWPHSWGRGLCLLQCL